MNSSSQKTAEPAQQWRLRTRTLAWAGRPLLMGILNVTPDSFSDGGRYFKSENAVAHGVQLAREGAAILDVGGESTRPGALRVDVDEQRRRVLPVIAWLSREVDVPISIDTSSALVAREAIDAGAEIINDVTALNAEPEMVSVAAQTGAAVCAMHMQGTPATMQDRPAYDDVLREVTSFLAARRDALIGAGVRSESIALDPGIGFGKTLEHNLTLLRNVGSLHRLGCPVLVGHSRKRFLRAALKDDQADTTLATASVALALAGQNVQILRVHDVKAVGQALALFAMCTAPDVQ